MERRKHLVEDSGVKRVSPAPTRAGDAVLDRIEKDFLGIERIVHYNARGERIGTSAIVVDKQGNLRYELIQGVAHLEEVAEVISPVEEDEVPARPTFVMRPAYALVCGVMVGIVASFSALLLLGIGR